MDHPQWYEGSAGGGSKIHSDFERGFIRAEIVSFNDLKANGSMTACKKEKGTGSQ